jgi:hypothetical protein
MKVIIITLILTLFSEKCFCCWSSGKDIKITPPKEEIRERNGSPGMPGGAFEDGRPGQPGMPGGFSEDGSSERSYNHERRHRERTRHLHREREHDSQFDSPVGPDTFKRYGNNYKK